jgi:hypothetical protein
MNIVKRSSSPNMLRLEIGSPELDLIQTLFYARSGVCIPAISIGKFPSNFVMFEAFDVQEFKNMTLFQFHRSDTFPF